MLSNSPWVYMKGQAIKLRKIIELEDHWTYLSGGPKIGIWPKIWDLSQFLGFDPIFGKNPSTELFFKVTFTENGL